MKLSLKKLELISIVLLYLTAIHIWTLPIQNNKLPFGDVDASSHFIMGDYMVSRDKSEAKVPYYIFNRYGSQNSGFPGYIWYPPQYWTNTAIAQVVGGERIAPVFIFIAVFSTLIILSSYLLIRRLFGFWPAILSSFLLIFSIRDYMIYLFGQWPQSLAFAFTPLVLYCFYQYSKYYGENKSKPIYLYMLALFLSAQFFFHPQGMIASLGALIVFNIMLLAKYKKIFFSIKHFSIAVSIFFLVSAILAPLNIGEFFIELVKSQGDKQGFQFDKLFKWYHGIKNDPGLPDFYFTYNMAHGSLQGGILSWWTIPFLLIGVLILGFRKKDEDFLLLGWMISFYFLSRMSVFGLGSRDIRMFAYEAHVFYPIIAIGLLSLSSFVKRNFQVYLKYLLIILFFLLAIFVNGKSAYETLNAQQYSAGRINPMQYEAAEWIMSNLPEDANIYDVGTLGYQYFGAKVKWMGVLSQRHFIVNDNQINLANYVLIDYSDALLLRNQEYIGVLQNFEKNFQNTTPLYDKNNIRVYQVAEIRI